MNKLLLASTALVASATFAMAEVVVSGEAEMGVFGVDSANNANDVDLQFFTDVDVKFTMAGETDSGLTFGAQIDLDESDGAGARGNSRAFDPNTQGGETLFVDGTYGRLSMGDTADALDYAVEDAVIGGSIADDNEHVGYNNNEIFQGFNGLDGQTARYEYGFGDFSAAVSAEIDDTGVGENTYGIGGRYSGEFAGVTFGAGLGYITNDSAEATSASLSGKMANGFQGVVNYTAFENVRFRNARLEDHIGVALGYEIGAFTVGANYGAFDYASGAEDQGYGLVANYDLGGGAELQAGYGYNDPAVGAHFDTYSFGLAMSF